MVVAKLDESGSVDWIKTYGGPQSEFIYSIITLSNGYVVCGLLESDAFVMKIEEDGTVLWSRLIGDSSEFDICYDIALNSDENAIYFIGET